MKNKGFTLVELLAVIVVLAIISIITIPMIGNVIEESKKKIGEASKNRKPRLGMKNSQESKEKVSKALKGRANTWYRRKVIQIEKNTNKIIKIFDYIKQAQIETGIGYGNIVAVCRGNRKTAGGYIWKYVEEV